MYSLRGGWSSRPSARPSGGPNALASKDPVREFLLLDEEVNERWLFHGTSTEGADAITRGDFRVDLAGSNAGTLYGKGVYLAEASSKSDEYSSEGPGAPGERLRSMLLCRVIESKSLATQEELVLNAVSAITNLSFRSSTAFHINPSPTSIR